MLSYRFTIRLGLLLVSASAFLTTGCPPPPPDPVGPTADFIVQRDPVDFTIEGEVELSPEDPLIGFDPQQVQFVDTSDPGTRDITLWRWDFGDGGTSEEQDPIHTYDKAGNFTVTLTVANGYGTTRKTRTNLVQIRERVGPRADFNVSPERGLDPLTVKFTDRSEAGAAEITNWSWNFGDGKTSTLPDPTHEYRALGTYDVTLTVTTEVGSDTYTETAAVQVVPPIEATFSPSATTGKAPLSVSFSNTSQEGVSTDVTWAWDFGDGAISSERNPTHEYKVPGVYTVTLVADNGVRNDTLVREDLIEVIAPVAPAAEFAATPVGGNAPLTVLFRDRSDNGTEPITSWEWYFGDAPEAIEGEADLPDSTEQSPIHIYQEPGTYTVSLIVRSADGESIATKENYITVFSPLTVDFSADAVSGLTPLTVNFSDQSNIGAGPVTNRLWNFGDGATSTDENPQHVYSAAGVYDVSLTITTPEGTVTETKPALIEAIEPVAPTAEFSAAPTAGPAPLDVAFSNESDPGTGDGVGYTWDFGDGATSVEESPSHTYTRLGTYSVGLEVVSSVGTSSETKVDLIRAETAVLTAGGDAADRLRAIVVADDGSFAVAGDTRSFSDGTTQVYFVRYEADGNFISDAVYSAEGNARAMDLVGAPDGGFVLAGEVETAEDGYDVFVIKVDSNGNEIWRVTVGNEANDRGTAVIRAAGGFLVVGHTDEGGDQDVLLVRLDSEGNVLWTRTNGGPEFDLANDVVAVSDGYWITGATARGTAEGSNVLIMKTDLTGDASLILGSGTAGEDEGNAIAITADGGLAIVGTTGTGSGASDVWLIRTADDGFPDWVRNYGGNGEEEGHAITVLPSGDFILAGSTTSEGSGLFDAFLVHARGDGTEFWTRSLGEAGSEIAFDLGVTPGGDYLLAGQSDSFGQGSLDTLVLKTDANGAQLLFP